MTALDEILCVLREIKAALVPVNDKDGPPAWPMTAKEFADYMKVSVHTVNRWVRAGQLKTTATGQRRITEAHAQAFFNGGGRRQSIFPGR